MEAFGRPDDGPPVELASALRTEYRTKLLNPRWAAAQLAAGPGGAYEVSQRFTALLGWGATAGFAEQFVWDGAHARYVEDEANAAALRRANPQAWGNLLRRSLEAARRGVWRATPDQVARLQALYADSDAELEGVAVAP